MRPLFNFAAAAGLAAAAFAGLAALTAAGNAPASERAICAAAFCGLMIF